MCFNGKTFLCHVKTTSIVHKLPFAFLYYSFQYFPGIIKVSFHPPPSPTPIFIQLQLILHIDFQAHTTVSLQESSCITFYISLPFYVFAYILLNQVCQQSTSVNP